jgi:maltose alpha-D-glucosyltransferase/alpha-amylase
MCRSPCAKAQAFRLHRGVHFGRIGPVLHSSKVIELWPQSNGDLGLLLDAYVAEKALYELRYELNNRPDWVDIPLHGLEAILKRREENQR